MVAALGQVSQSSGSPRQSMLYQEPGGSINMDCLWVTEDQAVKHCFLGQETWCTGDHMFRHVFLSKPISLRDHKEFAFIVKFFDVVDL